MPWLYTVVWCGYTACQFWYSCLLCRSNITFLLKLGVKICTTMCSRSCAGPSYVQSMWWGFIREERIESWERATWDTTPVFSVDQNNPWGWKSWTTQNVTDQQYQLDSAINRYGGHSIIKIININTQLLTSTQLSRRMSKFDSPHEYKCEPNIWCPRRYMDGHVSAPSYASIIS